MISGYLATDRNLRIHIRHHTIKYLINVIYNRSPTRGYTIEDTKDFMQSVKGLPKDQGKYIFTRYLQGKGKILNHVETCNKINISQSKGRKLMNEAIKNIAESMLIMKISRCKLIKIESIDDYLATSSKNLNFKIRLFSDGFHADDYEILECHKEPYSSITNYKVKVYYSKWIDKKEN
ncbi:hypothetical protein ACQV2T_08370 [Facklamia sp. P13069]|uniref:hypothetical protein n=1 Tax=Facklamia sp. P13069 TaxID=3421954 RepID=UPI003D16835E